MSLLTGQRWSGIRT